MIDVFVDNDFCFACGQQNPLGLRLQFFQDGDSFCTRFNPPQHLQGWRGVLHGGIQATILDDLMSNHLMRVEGIWAVTAELSLRLRKPVPMDRELLFSSRLIGHRGRVWELESDCRIYGENTGVLCTAYGRFMQIERP